MKRSILGAILALVLVLSIGGVLLPQSAVLAQAPLGNLSWAPRYMYGTDDNIVYTHYPEVVSGGWEALPADTRETILGQLPRAEYRPTSLSTTYPGSYGALNRAHALSLTFDADGVHVLPAQHDGDDSVPAWDWALRLIGYGYCEAVEAALPAKPTVSGNRVEYQRGDLSEWYLNDERGLEQGFILARPPVAEAGNTLPLRIVMAINTSLTPQLTDDGHTLLFHDAQGRVVLNYSELHAYDAGGTHLPTRMVLADDVADTMEHTLYLTVDDCGATYPITIDPLLSQVAKLTASDGAAWDCFGYSASISGDTVVVGAYYGGAGGVESGSAYVFERNHGGTDNWGEVKELIASDAAANDSFGWSVSISGDTVVVGAWSGTGSGPDSGSAYVFERNLGGPGNWGEVKELIASDGAASDWFGGAVSISGDTIVIGANADDVNKGSAYVFERNHGGADNWGEVKKMIASDGAAGDRFGFAVSISGDTIVIGANADDVNKGSAYVFERNQPVVDNWGQVKKLLASDGAADDQFGDSVFISGDTVVVGATGNDDNGSWSGSAYVFERNQPVVDNWGQVAKLLASDGAASDYFGYSVSISGDILVVSAPNNNGYVGSAYEFERNEGGADNWGQVAKLTASDGAIGDCFGWSVSISGYTLVVGAPGDADNGSWSGSAYIEGLTPEMNLKEGATDIADGGSYDFGSPLLNTNTDVSFTIENTGTADLTLTILPITVGGVNMDQFSIQTQPTSPVAASGSITFVVRFTPTSVGAKTANISIANNDDDENPYDLTIQGTARAPAITSFTPTLANTGTLVIINGSDFTGTTAVGFGGTAASSFTVNSDTSISAVVGSGSSGKIYVTTPSGTCWSADNFMFDNTPPTDPTKVQSTSHTIGTRSGDNTIDVTWTDAIDAGIGLDGYSILWDTSAATIPDAVKDIEEGVQAATSVALADGTSHYLHIRSVDNFGNWHSTAVHLGPFFIDTTPPKKEKPTPPARPAPLTAGDTFIGNHVGTTGVFRQTVIAPSADGKVQVIIEKGVRGLSEEGKRLSWITVRPVFYTPPPPAGAHIIGLAYRFQPSGATFDPPITITYTYDESEIPAGIAEEDLVIAVWDEANGQWVELTSTVDPVTNTITTQVSHFTVHAIIAYGIPPTQEGDASTQEGDASTQEGTTTIQEGANWGLIGGIIGACIVVIVLLVVLIRRK